MKKNLRTVLLVFSSVFFALCLVTVLVSRLPYWKSRRVYQGASQSYTSQNAGQDIGNVDSGAADGGGDPVPAGTGAASSSGAEPADPEAGGADSRGDPAQAGSGADGADSGAAGGVTDSGADSDAGEAAAGSETGEGSSTPELHSEKNNVPSADGRTVAPIRVDFEKLQSLNSDIIGWIYCEGTVIDYPVLQGATNDTYLHTLYTGEEQPSGSIFVDAANLPGFLDNNTIIYGHNMKDESMFGTLEEWQDQEYFDAHPCMWLLTPEQDYRVDLFSACLVSARHDTYTIFRGTGPELTAYLQHARDISKVESAVETDPNGRYVLLSTCAYTVYDDARSVVHGLLVPVDSAGGVPLA